MKLKIKSYVSGDEKTLEINSRSELLDVAKEYPSVYDKIADAPSLEEGLNILARYIGRSHMDATVVPDTDKIEDDFNVSGRRPAKIESLEDAARVLESDEEDLDIPENVVLEGSTHRW